MFRTVLIDHIEFKSEALKRGEAYKTDLQVVNKIRSAIESEQKNWLANLGTSSFLWALCLVSGTGRRKLAQFTDLDSSFLRWIPLAVFVPILNLTTSLMRLPGSSARDIGSRAGAESSLQSSELLYGILD